VKIAIIGGSGKMGRWFADFLLKDGREVVISGRSEQRLLEAKQLLGVEVAADNAAAVKGADYVLLSVPIDSFEEVVAQISPHIQPEQAVIDVTSVKVLPVAAMHKHIKKGLVLGAHPLFGPGARSMANQNFVLTPTNDKEATLAQKITGYLEAKGARVTSMSPQEHDEMMSVVLGLSHFIALVAADTLLSSGRLEQTGETGSTTYRVLLSMVASVVAEDPELYASLQMNLPGVVAMEKLFQGKTAEWADLVADKNRQEFIRRMQDLKNNFEKYSPDFGKGYENMYKIAEGW